jgi:hypothetical protein
LEIKDGVRLLRLGKRKMFFLERDSILSKSNPLAGIKVA